MSLIMKLPQIIDESRRKYEEISASADQTDFEAEEILCGGKEGFTPQNMLAIGDNLPFMKFLIEKRGLKNKINLIYIDPPFFSKTDYGAEIKLNTKKITKIPVMKQKAYHDTYENGMEEYLRMLTVRFLMMKELLSDDGSIWVHLDWHASHYVKVILDEIFGEKNFINEIIWQYKSGGVSKRHFAKKHDTLLFYAKSKNYYFKVYQEKSYNRGYKPYRFKGVREYRDELGWYTMVNRKDVWQMDMVGRTSAERTGYVTQKPEALIERILESCTKEGDLCADFFGGSGTMSAAADKMGRKWISCDIGRLATINAHKRLVKAGAEFILYKDRKDGTDDEIQGKIKADVSLQPSIISDKMMLHVELEGYEPGTTENIPVEKKFMPVIKDVIKNDSLQLINYWSVECCPKNDIFTPDACFCKENELIETKYETIGARFGQVRIKAVDIFGNCSMLTVEL